MLDHGAKAPAGRSITPHLVGPIHTPMMGEEASLLGVLARAYAFPVASITPHRDLMWGRFYPWLLTMTTHVRNTPGKGQLRRVMCGLDS